MQRWYNGIVKAPFYAIEDVIKRNNVGKIGLMIGQKKHVAVGQIGQMFGAFYFNFIDHRKTPVRNTTQYHNHYSLDNEQIVKGVFF